MAQRRLGVIIFIALLSLLMVSSLAQANSQWNEYDWRLVKEQDGISLATAEVPGSKFLAVKTIMTINTDLKSLLAHTLDVEAFPLWVQYCVDAKVIKRDSSTTAFTQYTVSRPPWPLKRRDVVMDVRVVYQDDEQIKIVGFGSDVEYPKSKGTVRIDDVEAAWHFTVMPNKQVKVENFIHANPAGLIPAWLNNHLMVDSPLKTFMGLRGRLGL